MTNAGQHRHLDLMCKQSLKVMWTKGGHYYGTYLSVRSRDKSHELIHMTHHEPIRIDSNGLLNLLSPQELLHHFGHIAAIRRAIQEVRDKSCSHALCVTNLYKYTNNGPYLSIL